ncbi:hypothetical protein PLESTB_000603400 [Pleodorina starrii]|uniref:Ubiquitin-like domain-containing protein n=1 Tax=Pleodorina starrii TaxID=330485 RepID=A0A9W6BHF4_9CHLO|nr:hypothetical protein PLESTM_000424300 [Pleodorina starrii]GLC52271.1 hypothetical protein PLESTB_000603400 [Pleodorina starrii]GLC77424.1 hypothetical protein PLESTF_001934500 [Pleodorina starrii]
MTSLLVLVAHSGRTLQLDVQPSTRVDAVQHALVSFTGIPVADQIAMYQGARLDPAKLLGAYRLPVDPTVAALEDHPVFLYCRSYLKPGAALPPPEALPPLQVQVPPLAEVNLAHPLHSAPSPLVRALPDYERHFQHHLATTRAYWDVAQARLQRCRQLLSEQEVQARAADAARANVEAHYNYILNSYQTFLDKYNAQHAVHATLLATFPSDLAALEAIELHPSLQQQQPQPPPPQQQQHPQQQLSLQEELRPGAPQYPPLHAGSAGGAGPLPAAAAAAGAAPRRLADLYPVQRLREWAETCSRSHASFGAKVSELEALFQLLRKDVEGLFMQAPSVDLDALGRQMAEHEALLDEHSSMVQVLSKDLRTVRTLVEDVVRQLGSTAGGGGGGAAGGGGGLRQGGLHDAAAAMEAIHETHRNRVLPRLAQLDGQLAAFAARVEASKVAMSRDVLSQLQRISGQQSRIRDMKNKLAAFHEVLGRQDAAFAELRVVHRLPSAYRALLAEVVRRAAWHQLYCRQAGRLAEHMALCRDKEAGRRTTFSAQVARYIPSDLLGRAGLASEPPYCQVTVPAPEVPLIAVAVADLQRLSYLDERLLATSSSLRASAAPPPPPHSAASSLHHHHKHPHPHAHHHPQQPQSQPHHHHHHYHSQPQSQAGSRLAGTASMAAFPGTVAVLDADPPPPPDSVTALEMENARLRAELANHIAAACIRELTAATTTSTTTTTTTSGGGGGGGGEVQQQPTAAAEPSAAAGTPRQASISGGGGGASPSVAAAGTAVATAAGSSPPPRRDPAELAAAMQRALAMKDDLIRQQQREMTALAARAATYEERIAALEGLLTQRATGGGSEAARFGDGSGGGGGGLQQSFGRAARQEAAEEQHQQQQEQQQQQQQQPGAAEAVVLPEAAAVVLEQGGDGGTAAGRLSGETDSARRAGGSAAEGGEVDEPGGTREGAGEPLSRPTLSVDVGGGGVSSGGGTSVLSPFSLQAAQHQELCRDGLDHAIEPPAPRDVARVTAPTDGSAAAASEPPPPPAAAAAKMYVSRSGSGTQPHRVSSGPQAIPQASAASRRGVAGDEPGPPYEPRVPMATGSLPFATSLPAGSALASRLASSPSGGGIGLGLALGFGLATLAEGPRRSGSPPREEHGSSSSSSSRRVESGSGGSGSGSGSARVSDDGGEERLESGGVRTLSSSGGLQFQPSWSAPASGDAAAVDADGARAADAGGAEGFSGGAAGPPAAAAGGATSEVAEATDGAADGGASATASAADSAGGGDDDDGPAEDVPDIDEVFDSDGAWEVASAATAAAAAATGTSAAAEAGALAPRALGRDAEVAAGGDGSGVGGAIGGAGEGGGDGFATQQLGTSSGYESVGSVASDIDA